LIFSSFFVFSDGWSTSHSLMSLYLMSQKVIFEIYFFFSILMTDFSGILLLEPNSGSKLELGLPKPLDFPNFCESPD
jgi:hypothetical protein